MQPEINNKRKMGKSKNTYKLINIFLMVTESKENPKEFKKYLKEDESKNTKMRREQREI
jgi:hypothetical protein